MSTIRELEPKEVWNRFADINAVPRPSKKEQKITAFMVAFGQKTWFRNQFRCHWECDYP